MEIIQFSDQSSLKINNGKLDSICNGRTTSNNFQTSEISRNKQLKMVVGSLYIPKENDSNPLGEDAHFVCQDQQTIGVADGVGGWIRKGVDSGVYARQLITNSIISVQKQYKKTSFVNPLSVLFDAYCYTTVQGSSTACIITINGNIVCSANIGDSGYMIIRSGKVVYRSPLQQHRFNIPYQLGRSNDNPFKAESWEVEAEAGDVLVAGTDGLFDNVDGPEMEEIIRRGTQQSQNPHQLALSIANSALYNSFDRFADTPFARASKMANHSHSGGKVDDITVIVAFIL